jgi:N-acetylated-alpha-linked acidic dipeptidase
MPVGDMGAGSDYAPFLQHLGIAAIDLGFGGEDEEGGVAHSIYDSFAHFERFGDPDGAYGVTLSRTAGRLVLRSAGADILPLRFEDFAYRVGMEVTSLHGLVDGLRQRTQSLNALMDRDAFALAADPTKAQALPERAAPVPDIDLGALDRAAAELQARSRDYDDALAHAAKPAPQRQIALNRLLQRLEHDLTDPQGLPGRPWYRHLIYEPGLQTGYLAKTLPGVREALEAQRWSEARDYVGRTAKALRDYAAGIEQATGLLKP